MRVAAIQLNSNAEVERNLDRAGRLVREAAAAGAELVALPEKWNLLGTAAELREGAEALDGPTLSAVAGWARELGVALLAGSIAERAEGAERLFNTSALFNPGGELVAAYRKIHMFDVDVGGISYRESESEQGGEEILVPQLELGDERLRLGMSVCYDLRFPELYRILAVRGALLLTIPSAFTHLTGRDHWEVLLRARAIENQCYVLAPNQVGEAPPHYHSFGHSAIVDPWGRVLAEAGGDEERFVIAELDLAELDRVRAELPSLANRRPAAYLWPEPEEAPA